MGQIVPEHHREVGEQFIAASQANDADAMRALCSPEIVAWHNFDGLEGGLDSMVKGLGWLHRVVDELRWTARALTPTVEGFVLQSTLTGNAPGGALHLESCVVVRLDADGRISHLDEYLDTAQSARLRA